MQPLKKRRTGGQHHVLGPGLGGGGGGAAAAAADDRTNQPDANKKTFQVRDAASRMKMKAALENDILKGFASSAGALPASERLAMLLAALGGVTKYAKPTTRGGGTDANAWKALGESVFDASILLQAADPFGEALQASIASKPKTRTAINAFATRACGDGLPGYATSGSTPAMTLTNEINDDDDDRLILSCSPAFKDDAGNQCDILKGLIAVVEYFVNNGFNAKNVVGIFHFATDASPSGLARATTVMQSHIRTQVKGGGVVLSNFGRLLAGGATFATSTSCNGTVKTHLLTQDYLKHAKC